MPEISPGKLSSSHLDWIQAEGDQKEVLTGTVLIQQGQSVNDLYILLEGSLAITVAQTEDNLLARAFNILGEGEEARGRKITQLSSGEIIGEGSLLHNRLSPVTVTATENALVLAIPREKLATQLQEDEEFAAQLYRVMAIQLSARLRQLIIQPGGKLAQSESLKQVLSAFGEFSDTDLDWIIAMGRREEFYPGQILIQQGQHIDALYFLLNGKMAVFLADDPSDPLASAFAALENTNTIEREIVKLSRGEIIGEISFINFAPSDVTVRAIEYSQVLKISIQQLVMKLNHDMSFAARFYRILCMLISDRLKALINRLGFGRRSYVSSKQLDKYAEFGEELDFNVEEQMLLAGTRFRWMLSRVGAD